MSDVPQVMLGQPATVVAVHGGLEKVQAEPFNRVDLELALVWDEPDPGDATSATRAPA